MSSVAEEVMGTGSVTVRLRDDTPGVIRDQLSLSPTAPTPRPGFASLMVTQAYLGPRPSFGTARAASLFWGVLRSRAANGLELSGPGPAFWLGDEDGKGRFAAPGSPVIIGYVPPGTAGENAFGSPGTPAWWAAAIAGSTLFSVGTVGVAPATPHFGWVWSTATESARKMLDLAAQGFGFEWRVRSTGTMDFATPNEIYGATPQTVVGPWPGEMPGGAPIVTAGRITASESLEEWVSRWSTRRDGTDGTSTRTDAYQHWVAVLAPTALGWGGWSEISGDPNEISSSNPGLLAALQARSERDAHNHQVTYALEIDDYRPSVSPCGSPIGVWDPDAGVFGGPSTHYMGVNIRPAALRIMAAEWPITEERGVYVHVHTTTSTVIDLTPYVEWGEGPASLTVGTVRPTTLSQHVRRDWTPRI